MVSAMTKMTIKPIPKCGSITIPGAYPAIMQPIQNIPQDEPSDEEWGRFGPTTIQPENAKPMPLPTLHPYKLVTNVKVPYTGKESLFTWYYTFRSMAH
jgi:hypothetical protein